MSREQELIERSGGACELCGAGENLSVVAVEPSDDTADTAIYICATCKEQMGKEELDENYWHCLNDSMWSGYAPVQVTAYRLLKRLGNQELLDQLYMEPEVLAYAEATAQNEEQEPTRDCNGAILQAGDTVVITKDLDVKGAGFTAKRGTAVRNISLTDNPEQIEGRVNGTKIVILTKFLKKQ